MTHKYGEVRDLPFLTNDMNDSWPTTDWPLDTADGPGKADAEMGATVVPERFPAVDADDAMIEPARDGVFQAEAGETR